MAQFKQWALEYVLSDDEAAQAAIAQKAAKGEKFLDCHSHLVLNCARH